MDVVDLTCILAQEGGEVLEAPVEVATAHRGAAVDLARLLVATTICAEDPRPMVTITWDNSPEDNRPPKLMERTDITMDRVLALLP